MKAKRSITEAEYLAELTAVVSDRPPAGAFTTLGAARLAGISQKKAECMLKTDVAGGMLKSKLYMHLGRMTRFYWIAK